MPSSPAPASPTPGTAGMAPAGPKPARTGTAVDLMAVVTATCLASLGLAQLFAPAMAAPLSGIGLGTASDILSLQWLLMAFLMFVGGATRVRVVTIFAAEFVVVGSLAALVVIFIREPSTIVLIVHGGIAAAAFASSGLARLTDKAELKREIRLLRETAAAQPAAQPVIQEGNTDAE